MARDPDHVFERVVIPDPRVGEGYPDTVLRCEVYENPGARDAYVFSEAPENWSLRWDAGQTGLRAEVVNTLVENDMAPDDFRYIEHREPTPGMSEAPYEEYTFAKGPSGELSQTGSSIAHSQEQFDHIVDQPSPGLSPSC